MTSMLHEGLLLLFRNRPTLAPELLQDVLGVELPAYTEARIDSAELKEAVPTEYRADLVVLLLDGKLVHAIVVEVQIRRDKRKRRTWPLYLTHLHTPELAVLSALAHGRQSVAWAVARAAFHGTRDLEAERHCLYMDLVVSSLNGAARAALEEMMWSGAVNTSTRANLPASTSPRAANPGLHGPGTTQEMAPPGRNRHVPEGAL